MPQLSTVTKKFGSGGTQLWDNTLRDALNTLLGHAVIKVAGAAAGTAMALPSLRKGDTLLSVLPLDDTTHLYGAEDAGNCTIQETRAQGTVTISGNPVDGDTVVVGRFTYTFKTIPTAQGHVKITAGNNNQMATDLAAAINAQEALRSTYSFTATSNQTAGTLVGAAQNTAENSALASTNTVVVTNLTDGTGNAPAVSNSAHITVSNNNTADVSGTVASAVNADTLTIVDQTGANVVFTVRTVPTVGTLTDILLANPYTDVAQALNIVNAVNCYQFNKGNLGVVASVAAASAVVHFKPIDPARGNITPFTKTATNVAVDGTGTLGGTTTGTATGSFKSVTALAGKTLYVQYYHATKL